MNRNSWIVAGILLLILIIFGAITLRSVITRLLSTPEATPTNASVVGLDYCSDSNVKPCVVSFGLDAEDNMLVNLLLPDLSFPAFYLKVLRGDSNGSYDCQRVVAAPNNAYCIGEELPPGETLHLMLFSIRDDALLAQGDLSIIGLAFPTLAIVTPTEVDATETPSMTEAPDETQFPPILTTPQPPISTPIQFPTETPGQPSYP